ncbi:hypothetical protein FGK63_01870 [Ruegeria sediminis]|uniref:DUF4258 domain-containing protein n=1 Tax=Ruegeria sediminis TaxID=2583820 RepID=A0ABY2X387_9RHOB|nr:hypothetical protein [Ruegeria sediminis]TMV09842.1 hypothetical protein FGK63_01870 [Ruegeria sediminis]
MKKPMAHVTDHAVLRYLERVKGLDVETIRREIGHIVDLAVDHPAACGVVSGGFVYRMQEGAVITVIPQASADLRTGRARGKRGYINE